MTQSMIVVDRLSKTYRVPERPPGLAASLRSLVHRTYTDVPAVQEVSFTIGQGEVVGFIGPNGAGKTTTLKMLAGLLHPSGGAATVAEFTPWQRDPAYLGRIGMVLGNKSQLLWDIPPLDSYHVLAEIYRIAPADFRRTLDELVELLDMAELLTRPVRNLSLGERMKCEMVAALLHRPDVLFLDEPTLGLDVSIQRRLRRFVREYTQRSGATVILTSHYMADVAELCARIILIHHGGLLYDGPLGGLVERLAPFKLLRLTLNQPENGATLDITLPEGVDVIEREGGRLVLRAARSETPALTARLLSSLPVIDLAVEDPPVEAVIDQVYQEGAV